MRGQATRAEFFCIPFDLARSEPLCDARRLAGVKTYEILAVWLTILETAARHPRGCRIPTAARDAVNLLGLDPNRRDRIFDALAAVGLFRDGVIGEADETAGAAAPREG